MNYEMKEMMEELNQMVVPVVGMSQLLYETMANNDALIKGVAKFHAKLVAAFEAEGFTRKEAINMAVHSMTTLGGGSKK
jgi:hypothetical protein